ncbi:cilia- and flagella-associated protein 161 isoform X3 [Callithrix jacchus]
MAQNRYGPGVRMGNWNEDAYLEEMQLSITEDGYIHYGDKVMLVNPDDPDVEADMFLGGDLSLCMTPDEIQCHLRDELEVPCGLSAVQAKTPMGRNIFIILSIHRDATGQVLRYGQDFSLGITGGFENKMLYLSSDHRTLLKSSKRSLLQEVYLTDEVSHMNCWQAAFPDPQLRLEYEGFPVPANAKILINHCHTNRGLAVHRHLFLSTYFGKEAEVVAHTHLDSHRVEKPSNHWMLVTGNPRDASSTMLDLPKPPAEDTRAVEQAMGLDTQ